MSDETDVHKRPKRMNRAANRQSVEAPPRPKLEERVPHDGGKLYLSRDGRLVTVRAVLVNEQSWKGILTHELFLQRTGPSGCAQISQSGHVTIDLGHVKTLAEKTVSVTDGDFFFASLIVREGTQPVDEAYSWREFDG